MENIDLTCDHQQKCQLEMHQRAAGDRATAHRQLGINWRHVFDRDLAMNWTSLMEVFSRLNNKSCQRWWMFFFYTTTDLIVLHL